MSKGYAKRMAQHSGLYAIGNIARQLVGFIMLPVYTQYLSPADYGVIGLLTFVIGLIDIAFGARLVQAVPKFFYPLEDRKQRHAVISTALLQTSLISIVTMLIVVMLREPLSVGLFESGDYKIIVAILAITILTQAVENYGLLFIRIQENPILFVTLNLCKLTVQVILNVWLIVYLELGVLGVAVSSAGASVLFAVILAVYTLAKTGLKYNRSVGWQMVLFCWPLWIAGLASLYVGSSNRYYMSLFGSLDDVGLYELASKFAAIVPLLVWRPFNMFWQTERFKLYEADKPAPKIYQYIFWLAATVLIAAGLGVSIFADVIIRIMAAPDYHAASSIVAYLVLASVFNCLLTFFNFSVLATNHTRLISINNYYAAAFATVFFIALIPLFGFYGAAIGICLTNGAQMLNMKRIARKYYDLGINLLPLVCMILIAAAGTYLSISLRIESNLFYDIASKLGIFLVFASAIIAVPFSLEGNRQYIQSKILHWRGD